MDCGASHNNDDEIPEPSRPTKRPNLKKLYAHSIKEGKSKPFHLTIPVSFSFDATLYYDTYEELWRGAGVDVKLSIFRGEFLGLKKDDEGPIIPIGDALLPGKYTAAIHTAFFNGDLMVEVIEDAVLELNKIRPLIQTQLAQLETELLNSKFVHASLTQEGSTITLNETVLLSKMLSSYDPLHVLEKKEVDKMADKTTSSIVEVQEAVNHIQIARRIQDLIAGGPLTENVVLDIHKGLMQNLLTDAAEGGPGEYRKVDITINGATVERTPVEDVQREMTEFFEELRKGKKETESIYRFLARIHQQFQLVHPFRDGNGRIGRIMMNIIALQHRYPVIFYAPEHRALFCNACGACDYGNFSSFERMIQEAFYVALQTYEKITPGPLIILSSE